MQRTLLGLAAAGLVWSGSAAGAGPASEWHVAPAGDDRHPGTKAQPFATLERARQAARAAAKPATVWLHGGTFYLPGTLVLSAEDSGVTWQAAAGETPVISGGSRLELTWESYRDGIMRAKVPAGFATDQLFVNGARQPMARYPNFDAKVAVFNGYAADAISPERVKRWAAPKGGYIHALHNSRWGGMHYVITGKDEQGGLTYEGGWQNNRPSAMHREYRFVENIFEELDAPGEWFLDAQAGWLYFYPPGGLELKQATVEGVRLKSLVELRGVKSVTLRGLVFRHAARTFMQTREPLLRTDWAIYRGGAVYFNRTEDCALEDCFLDELGGNSVFVDGYNRRVAVRGCHISKAGGNGIAFVGDPQAVRNGIGWKEHNEYAAIDRTPGPKSDDYPADCLVDDCLIHETGRIEKQTAPVEIDMAQSITIRHCSLYDVPRAGINIGDGCWGGHVIEFCDIFDTVQETGDHGSFNSWGRDRFWGLKDAPAGELPELALLDMVKPNVLRNNRWRCDHGWDVDLDDGSSNYEIYNNLFLRGGLKLREGFQRRVWNNIAVNNSLHPHVWYPNSGDIVTNNLWMTAYRPAGRMPPGKWGRELDHNWFTAEADRVKFAAHGCDGNSQSGEPLFLGPAAGDYRVKESSPVLKLGFRNFPMDQFGVIRPELKKLARHPSFAVGGEKEPRRDGKVYDWFGVKVKNIVGQGEMSAYGTAGETGVLVVELPPGHAWGKAGLRKDDVIVGENWQPLVEVQEVLRIKPPAGINVRRNQVDLEIQLGAAP